MRRFSRFVKNYPGAIVMVIVIIIGTCLSPVFFTVSNLADVLQLSAENGLLAAGMTLVLISGGGGVDLSVGSNFALGSMAAAMTQAYAGWPVWASVLLAVAVTFVIGAGNGLLVTKGKLQPFVATLVMMMFARAAGLLINEGKPVSTGIPVDFKVLSGTKAGVIALPAVIWIVAIIVIHFLITRTKYGRNLVATGGNEEAAANTGINVGRTRFWAYAICGILVGIASCINVSRMMIGEPRGGVGYEMLAIAAAVMGGVSMSGGKGNGIATLFGVIALGVIQNMMNVAGINMHLQDVVEGVIVFLAVLVPMFSEKLAEKAERRALMAEKRSHNT